MEIVEESSGCDSVYIIIEERVEESSWCNVILYYKSLLLLVCIQLVGRRKKETV